MIEFIIALGGNIGNTKEVFASAAKLIAERVGEINKVSSFYETEPVLHPQTPVYEQDNYLNAAMSVRSVLSPHDLLDELLSIEKDLGRERTNESGRWGPRLIDLDIIAAEDVVLAGERLSIPHPEMAKRRFVLEPMMEIAPDWKHPLLELSVKELFHRLIASE